MLTAEEKALLAEIDDDKLLRYMRKIAGEERLSGGEGTEKAVEFLVDTLEGMGIETNVHRYPAVISHPKACNLQYEYQGGRFTVPAKVRCFSAAGMERGKLIFIPAAELPQDILQVQLESRHYRLDLAGKIVISDGAGPAAVWACGKRGARGFIHHWKGEEELLHEGVVNPVWGTPMPGEDEYYPPIPVVTVNQKDGNLLKRMGADIPITLTTEVEEKVILIPQVECVIRPTGGAEHYLLIGNHLDSWYEGVTDNGTGNSLALLLAEVFYRHRQKLKAGVRILWWTGHSDGRYAGSALYTQQHFSQLNKQCLAYMNIDMPGLRGATDYSQITCGFDLLALGQSALTDVTGFQASVSGPMRSWEQSMQNIGVSPYFIWASTLPPKHPDRTNDSFMSWWWHTEADLEEYYDPDVLHKDAEVYLLAAYRLLQKDPVDYDIDGLLAQMKKSLNEIGGSVSLTGEPLEVCQTAIEDIGQAYHMKKEQLSIQELLYIVRKLNQLLYTERGAHLQDWALQRGFFPGLQAARQHKPADLMSREHGIWRHYVHAQINRIVHICADIKMILR